MTRRQTKLARSTATGFLLRCVSPELGTEEPISRTARGSAEAVLKDVRRGQRNQ